MPIPTPEERLDLYDDMDCRPPRNDTGISTPPEIQNYSMKKSLTIFLALSLSTTAQAKAKRQLQNNYIGKSCRS
jgi:hypothetical protein